jgi:t-SNARE complex subunit (syntaxin)
MENVLDHIPDGIINKFREETKDVNEFLAKCIEYLNDHSESILKSTEDVEKVVEDVEEVVKDVEEKELLEFVQDTVKTVKDAEVVVKDVKRLGKKYRCVSCKEKVCKEKYITCKKCTI